MESSFRVYVCTNIHCRANGGDTILRTFEQCVWEADLTEQVEVMPGGCQSRCSDGPNAAVWPGPTRYGRLTPALVRQIVAEHLRGGEPLSGALANPDAFPFR